MTEKRKHALRSVLDQPGYELIVFKVVSDPEDSQEDLDCIDIG